MSLFNQGCHGCGIVNVGNTCFMSAVLQCLARIEPLRRALDVDRYNDRMSSTRFSRVLDEWNRIRGLLLVDSGSINPGRLIEAIQYTTKDSQIVFGQQNDAGEFLVCFLDLLHNALACKVEMKVCGMASSAKDGIAEQCYKAFRQEYESQFSPIVDIFNGISIAGLCEVDKSPISGSLVPEMFNTLVLQIPGHNPKPTLTECFRSHCEDELLTGKNSWFDESRDEKREVVRWTGFWSLPQVLVIEFKRRLFPSQRENRAVHTSLVNIDLSQFIKGYGASSYVYDVKAICYHSGSATRGHCTAACNISGANWVFFNDEHKTRIDPTNLINGDITLMFLVKQS